MNKRDLADFLRRRREARRPGDVGLPAGGGRRRTPGLRREEVAWLAGVSTNYYERLEQARAPRPSSQVLAALGAALRLTETESEHLARLAGQAPPAPEKTEPVPQGVLQLLDRLGPVPAYVVDERLDVVAWNALAARLIADFDHLPREERNVLRLSMRGVCAAHGENHFARQAAAELRVTAARHPDDPAISELIREYAEFSTEFEETWQDHEVQARPTLLKRIEHPEFGSLDLDWQTLHVPGQTHRIILLSAEPGTPAHKTLENLRTPTPAE